MFQVIAEIAKTDWAEYRPRPAAQCLVAMGVVLIIGLLSGFSAGGVMAAVGTLMVGFSSFRTLRQSRILPMLLTTLGISLGAAAGTLFGHDHLVTTAASGAGGLVYGLLLTFNDAAAWICLQVVIAFLVATAFPAYGLHALGRSALLLGGGALQMMSIISLGQAKSEIPIKRELVRCHPILFMREMRREVLPFIASRMHFHFLDFRYALRLSLTLMIAVLVARLLNQQNSYWLPMTTLIVMKPDFYRTYTSSVSRVVGTVLGVMLASLIAIAWRPSAGLLIGFVLVFAWICFSWQKVNYAIFTMALTSFIVFLIAVIGLPEAATTGYRLLDTLLGSGLALASRAIGPRWDSAFPLDSRSLAS